MNSSTDPRITRWADQIMTMVDEDISEGVVPADVVSFRDLHGHVDANDYLEHADVPYGTDLADDDDPAGVNLVNEVTDEVTRRLAARRAAELGVDIEPCQFCDRADGTHEPRCVGE